MRLLWVFVFVALSFLFQCNNNNAPSDNGGNVTVDTDNDGLIDISTAQMLSNMRYDLAGTSYKTSATDPGNSSGCPTSGCNGYELTANIDLLGLLDANTNGQIDKTTVTIAGVMHTVIDIDSDKDTSWVPVGDDASRFTGTFEGNGHTIANLWVNVSSSSRVLGGLFGVIDGTVAIRNVGVVSGGVTSSSSDSSSDSGGLVGVSVNTLAITNSYFSGEGGVSSSSGSSSYSGGLVGFSSDSLTITNSYFFGSAGVSSSTSYYSSYSGGLVGFSSSSLTIRNSYFSSFGGVSSFSDSSSSDSSSNSGGLVGLSNGTLMIRDSYFGGSGGVSSSSSGSSSSAGGLVGVYSSLTITNSYFSGEGGVSSSSGSSSYSGGLVGFSSSSSSVMITNSYWNTDAPQSTGDGMTPQGQRAQGDAEADPMGSVGLTLTELQATSSTSPNLGLAWDLGTDQQNPAVKRCILNTEMTGCASPVMYGALLARQRNNNSNDDDDNDDDNDADSDHDGLIDISTAQMLNNMRYDLAGTSYKTSATDQGDSSGCPAGGCSGYELTANIDLLGLLDANTSGQIETITKTIAGVMHTIIDVSSGQDESWVPVGDNSTGDDTSRFMGTFEGNGNTIANLWVNISSSSSNVYAGLFGATGGSAKIHNVGVISGGVSSSSDSVVASSSYSGALVGFSSDSLTITNSYFSGSGGVSASAYFAPSSSSYSGGLVGRVSYSSSLMITNSYFFGSGGVSASGLVSRSGGLVGFSSDSLTITNSYFSGNGGVSASAYSAASASSGGLVGQSTDSLTITNSYFSGSGGVSASATFGHSSSSYSGGLVGRVSYFSSLMITNSYFSGSGGVSASASLPYSGGLAGFSSSSSSLMITNSYFSGSGGVSASGLVSRSGGLVGFSSSLTITNSYFSGSGGVSASATFAVNAFSGGLVGFSSNTPVIMNSYWNTDAPQLINRSAQVPKRAQGDVTSDPMGAVGLTLTELKATSGTYPNLLGDAWNLGTTTQHPAIKLCILNAAMTGCASPATYGNLLDGQR